ncbi:hypothetical protein MPSEU_000320800 [Mayamaea pseudoterrestris]|nr:hypothetical protein MPSEU_000320800 [Mayamaea pseudoterrestris]
MALLLRNRRCTESFLVIRTIRYDNRIKIPTKLNADSIGISARRWFASSSSSSRDPLSNEKELLQSSENENESSETSDPLRTHASASTAKSSSSLSRSVAYLDLAKARLSALVVTTSAAGFLAAGGPISSQLDVLGACLIGTGLCSASAAAMNQLLEVSQDSRMKRTQQRPLVTGALTLKQARNASIAWAVSGTSLLYIGTDPVTTALGVSNIVLYSGVYTYMKKHSTLNTYVGAVVGAIPPVMGYSAATGGAGMLDPASLVLAGTLYLWQLPHFFALSYCNRIDYQRGNFQMVSCLEENGQETAQLITKYAWYLSAMPFVATLCGATSSMFALEGLALNAYALHVAHRFRREKTNQNARKVFLTSLWYLPTFLMLYLLHSKKWDEEKKDDFVAKTVWDWIHNVREKGKELCLHEVVVSKSTDGEKACPVTIGQSKGKQGMDEAAELVAAATAVADLETIKTTVDMSDKREKR